MRERRGRFKAQRHTEKQAVRQQGQRLERRGYRPREAGGGQQPPEARSYATQGGFFRASRRDQPHKHLDLRLLASRLLENTFLLL